MQLKIYKSLWGAPRIGQEAMAGYKNAGYDGIEYKGLSALTYNDFPAWLKEYELSFITQIHTEGKTVEDHLYSFESLIDVSLPLNPVLINSQSGCDHWSLVERFRFMEGALRVEERTRIPIAHETHRSRITYTPWDTAALIDHFPSMRIGCDLSHWVNVCERLLTTESVHLEKTFTAAIHLHARVGYEQGPQVPDPRAPEYKTHLDAFHRWWRSLWDNQRKRGMAIATACPEYGPPPYQHTLPYTSRPVRDTGEISEWAMHALRTEFKAFAGDPITGNPK